ncbi:hypothetical protein CAPTEDRAFT_215522 [Capitella teleta]|uniref:Chitin-binding type-2 domain-containing protein n=1 Tax=Capitella teleta TaxID=283909 RepID=R7UNT4_CAPTE|nr:hypothetical protein CAPTEDRAFT_215522 [Capitella teleta]|eukprot:ELU05567.1 hypothetical protein CAPTEDRAFT_215522 [Capitella teleta]
MELIWRILIICIAACVSSAFPPRQTYQWPHQPQAMNPETAAPVTNAPIPATVAPGTSAPATAAPVNPATATPSGGHFYGQSLVKPWVNPWGRSWAYPNAGQPWSYRTNAPSATAQPAPIPATAAPTVSPTVAPTNAPTDAPTAAPTTQTPGTAQPESGRVSGVKCEGIYPYGYRRSLSVNTDAFEICDNGIWIRMNCAPGTWFQESTQQCTNNFGSAPGYGSVWNPSANTWQGGNGASSLGGSGSGTPAGKTARDARNGHYYYECISDLSGGGRWIHRACALGSIFNHVTGNCGRKDAAFDDDSVWGAPWPSDTDMPVVDDMAATTAAPVQVTTTAAPEEVTTTVADGNEFTATAMPGVGQGSHYGYGNAAPLSQGWVQPWANPWASNPWSGAAAQPWYGGSPDFATDAPTGANTNAPTAAPTVAPTVAPTAAPTNTQTNAPTNAPIGLPSVVYPQPWSSGSGYNSWGSAHLQKNRKLTIQLQIAKRR